MSLSDDESLSLLRVLFFIISNRKFCLLLSFFAHNLAFFFACALRFERFLGTLIFQQTVRCVFELH